MSESGAEIVYCRQCLSISSVQQYLLALEIPGHGHKLHIFRWRSQDKWKETTFWKRKRGSLTSKPGLISKLSGCGVWRLKHSRVQDVRMNQRNGSTRLIARSLWLILRRRIVSPGAKLQTNFDFLGSEDSEWFQGDHQRRLKKCILSRRRCTESKRFLTGRHEILKIE